MDRNDHFSLLSSDEAGESAGLLTDASDARRGSRSTIQRLRSAVHELLTALTSTLNDERDCAKESLSTW